MNTIGDRSHFKKICRVCKTVIEQCRCPSAFKMETEGVCPSCEAKLAAEELGRTPIAGITTGPILPTTAEELGKIVGLARREGYVAAWEEFEPTVKALREILVLIPEHYGAAAIARKALAEIEKKHGGLA